MGQSVSDLFSKAINDNEDYSDICIVDVTKDEDKNKDTVGALKDVFEKYLNEQARLLSDQSNAPGDNFDVQAKGLQDLRTAISFPGIPKTPEVWKTKFKVGFMNLHIYTGRRVLSWDDANDHPCLLGGTTMFTNLTQDNAVEKALIHFYSLMSKLGEL